MFRDLNHTSPNGPHLKAQLASKMLDREGLTVRGAHSRTGIAAADFSRIRNADLGRFVLDRLVSIINRLGSRVEVGVRVTHPAKPRLGSIRRVVPALRNSAVWTTTS